MHPSGCSRSGAAPSIERQLAAWQSRVRRWREFDADSQSSVAECFDAAYVSRMKVPDTEPLPTKRPLKVSDPWRHEWQRGVQVSVLARQEQPKPSVRYLDEGEDGGGGGPSAWRLPRKLLTSLDDYTYDPDRQMMSSCGLAVRPGEPEPRCRRYCADELDRRWLDALVASASASTSASSASVTMDTLEAVITACESLAHERMIERLRTVAGLGIEYDTTVPCSVCQSLEVEEDNEILFCDGCDTPVHQACYGVSSVPSGSWLCRPCSLGIRPVCALCSSSGGAMKATRDGVTWCHVSCALWIPEVGFADPERMEPITRLNEIPTGRWNLVCRLCRERVGACIQCCVRQCKVAFHVTCAFKHKLVMRQVLSAGDVRNLAYCERHGDKFRQTGVTPSSSPSKARPKYKGATGRRGGGGGGGGGGSGFGRGRPRKRPMPESDADADAEADAAFDTTAGPEAECAEGDSNADSSLEAKRPRLDETAVEAEAEADADADADNDTTIKKESAEIEAEEPTAEQKVDVSELENQRNQLLKDLETNFYTLFTKEELAARLAPVTVDARSLSLMLDYWKLKRTANGCHALLELPDDQELRPVNSEERRLQERAQMFVSLRHDMERVRNLCYLIVRREKLKRQLMHLMERASAVQLKPTRKNKWLRRLQPDDWQHLTGAHLGNSIYDNRDLLLARLPQPSEPADAGPAAAAAAYTPAASSAALPAPDDGDDGCLDPSEICLTDGDYRRLQGRERRGFVEAGGLATPAEAAILQQPAAAGAAAASGGSPRRQVARRRRRAAVVPDVTAAPMGGASLSATPSATEAETDEVRRVLRQIPARALRVPDSVRRRLRAGLRDPKFRRLIAGCPSSSEDDDDDEAPESASAANLCDAADAVTVNGDDADDADCGEPTPTPPTMADTDIDADATSAPPTPPPPLLPPTLPPSPPPPPPVETPQLTGNLFEKLSKA